MSSFSVSIENDMLKLVAIIFYQIFIFHQMIALWNYEKCFLFYLKNPFCSQDFHLHLFFPCQPLFYRLIQENLKPCVRYFSLFLKDKFLCYLDQSTLKRNLTYSCFFFPSLREHSLSLELPQAPHLLKTWFEKWTAWETETMLLT